MGANNVLSSPRRRGPSGFDSTTLDPRLRGGDASTRPLEYRAFALLLDYPSELLQEILADVSAALQADAARELQPLLERIATTDLLELQSEYLDTFDRGRRTSLNLFEHVHGDSRDRGQAMVDLLATYEAAGLAYHGDQLPDYLPVFLDYLALLPAEQARTELSEITHILQTIAAALARRRSAYLPLLALLIARAGETLAADAEVEDDTSFEAIDAAYKEAQVEFLGAALENASCTTTRTTDVQPIHIHRRAS